MGSGAARGAAHVGVLGVPEEIGTEISVVAGTSAGSLSAAMSASLAVPGLFPPVEIDGRLLIDGSIIEPVPVAAATTLGANQVIAVSVGVSDNTSSPLARSLQTTANVLGTQSRTDAIAAADVLVEPAIENLARWSHRDVPAIIEAGRQVAVETFGPSRGIAATAR